LDKKIRLVTNNMDRYRRDHGKANKKLKDEKKNLLEDKKKLEKKYVYFHITDDHS
jgi:hypothetical protein